MVLNQLVGVVVVYRIRMLAARGSKHGYSLNYAFILSYFSLLFGFFF